MPLEKYKNAGLLFNLNFLEKSKKNTELMGYRGELVLVEGEIADSMGHAKPPAKVMRGVAMLSDDKLKLAVGAIDDITQLTTFIDKYKEDFAPDMKALIYVVNIEKPAQVVIEGINFVLIPLVQGVPWNELLDELALDKSDFKGQSPADKIVTVLGEMQGYKPTYPSASLEEVLASANDTVREGWGAI